MAITAAELLVKVGADIGGFQRGMAQVNSGLDRLKGVGAGITRVGAAITAGVTLPIIGMGAAVAKAAIDWESAFAGVRKTVNATETQLKQLEKELLAVSSTSPVSPEQIAKIAELGGQLGIAADQLTEFSKTIAALSVSTNLTAEEGAMALAQFVNITKPVADSSLTASQQVARLGATIVELGNNLATTEADILHFAQRVAGAGATVGISQADILGWAAALSSVGIEAEAGGTAISRVFLEMSSAVAEGGKELQLFAAVSGMSTDEFARKFKENASEATLAFLGGIAKMRAEGQNLIPVLEELGLNEIRVRDMILRASGATDLVTRSLSMARQAYEENNALTEEAGKRYATTASQMEILRNNLQILGITIGQALLPAINEIVQALIPVVKGFAQWAKEHPGIVKLGVAIAAVVAVIGPVVVGIGMLISAISTIGSVISGAVSAIGAIIGAIAAIGWPVLVVIGILAALYLAWRNNWLGIRDFLKPVIDTIVGWISGLVSQIVGFFRWLYDTLLGGSLIPDLVTGMLTWFSNMVTFVTGLWSNLVYSIINFASQILSQILAWLATLYYAFVTSWNTITNTVIQATTNMWKQASGILNSMKENILSILGSVVSGAYEAGKSLAARFGEGIMSKLRDVYEKVKDFVGKIRALLPGSDAKEGPLSDLYAAGRALPARLAAGISSGGGVLAREVQRQLAAAMAVTANIPAPAPKNIPISQRSNDQMSRGNITINIHNPVGEPSEESITRQLRNLAYLGVLSV
jgi:TP901 family phage tail tape measure protein